MKILIAEDEKRLSDALMHIMSEHKFIADAVDNGKDAYDYASAVQYDCIIMDVMMPGMDGFEVVKKLREAKINTPVLMLTARASIRDKVDGLNNGADDYMTKPFSTEELLARISALTRRQGEIVMNELTFADLKLDLQSCMLSCGSETVKLSFKEFEIMKQLMSNPTFVTPKEQIIENVWGIDSEAEDNNVEAYISFLRKKLKFTKSKVTIKNRKKIGYILEVLA